MHVKPQLTFPLYPWIVMPQFGSVQFNKDFDWTLNWSIGLVQELSWILDRIMLNMFRQVQTKFELKIMSK